LSKEMMNKSRGILKEKRIESNNLLHHLKIERRRKSIRRKKDIIQNLHLLILNSKSESRKKIKIKRKRKNMMKMKTKIFTRIISLL
jgi:hypothetical protein